MIGVEPDVGATELEDYGLPEGVSGSNGMEKFQKG